MFWYFTKILKPLHIAAQAPYFTKIHIQIFFFSQTQLTQQHKARLFSLQLLTYCSTIGISFSHISHGDRSNSPYPQHKCLNNWFEVLSTRATLIQTLVSQLIGTNKQSIKSS